MPASDLLVYTKTENLLFRLYPVLVNYLNKKGVLKVDKNKIKKEGINNANQNA